MIKFYCDEEFQFPIWINKDMVVYVEPDKKNEHFTHIELVNGCVVVYGLMENVVETLRRSY